MTQNPKMQFLSLATCLVIFFECSLGYSNAGSLVDLKSKAQVLRDSLVLVTMDPEFMKLASNKMDGSEAPLGRRQLLALLVRSLKEAGVKSLTLDLYFNRKTPAALAETQELDDSKVAQAWESINAENQDLRDSFLNFLSGGSSFLQICDPDNTKLPAEELSSIEVNATSPQPNWGSCLSPAVFRPKYCMNGSEEEGDCEARYKPMAVNILEQEGLPISPALFNRMMKSSIDQLGVEDFSNPVNSKKNFGQDVHSPLSPALSRASLTTSSNIVEVKALDLLNGSLSPAQIKVLLNNKIVVLGNKATDDEYVRADQTTIFGVYWHVRLLMALTAPSLWDNVSAN